MYTCLPATTTSILELPRVAEIIRDSSPDVTGVDDSLPRLMDGAAGVVTDGVADGVTDGEAVETSGGITVLVEFETIISVSYTHLRAHET